MALRELISNNLGYALLGGPTVALVVFGVGTLVTNIALGGVLGVTAYGIGWILATRASTGSVESDSEDGQSRRERELEMEKGAYGGNSGGA